MHKIRNTKHKEILESLAGTIPPGYSQPLSKHKLRILCNLYKWDKKKVIKIIEDDYWWVHFVDD